VQKNRTLTGDKQMQKNILCFGDSNTWGFVPQDNLTTMKPSDLQRYNRNQRWTGLLQKKLGENFYIIEEGLNGRTTNLDYHLPPNRNGKAYLPSCLYSHSPLDLVVFVALGGNDLKTCYNRSPEEISHGLAELIDIVQHTPYGPEFKKPPEILLISMPIPLEKSETFLDENNVPLFSNMRTRAEKLYNLNRELAAKKNCHFLDVNGKISPSEIDGLHLDQSSHALLAELVSEKIVGLF